VPTVTITENSSGGTHSGTEDVYLREQSPTANQDSQELNVFSYASGDRGNLVIRFTLPAVLAGATINSATLTLRVIDKTTTKTIDVHRCLRAWTETGATWNTYDGSNSWATAGGTGSGDMNASATASVSATAGVGFDQDFTGLAADVQAWVGGAANHGWLLKRNDYTAYDGHYITFRRSEGTDGQRPILTIDYTAGGGGGSAALAITGSAGTLSAVAGSPPLAALAITGSPGTLSASASTLPSITSEPLKDNAGNLLASTALDFVAIYNDTTGALVVRLTGLSTNAGGRFVAADAALSPGTTYRVDWQTSAGQRRMPRKAAA
jgi:hypothetical protein